MSRSCRPLLLLACCALAASAAPQGGVVDLLRNFDAVDPDVLNVLTFERAGRPARRRVDAAAASEMDIGDLDTSDILHCFGSLSYACFQKKIIVYLDSLNRVDRINLFGGYVSFVRLAPAPSAPITEQLLASRRVTDRASLAALLRDLYDDFFDSHLLRITVPGIDARLDARSARAPCYDFAVADAKDDDHREDATATGPSDARNKGSDSTCYRGDQSMVALSSALVLKLLMVLPTLMKIIAAKAIFGLVMGVISVIISKMAILPILLSYSKKSNVGYTTTSSYKQGASSISFSPTTDNYRLYYRPDHPGRPTIAVRPPDITTTAGGLSGFGAMPVPIRDISWPPSTYPSKSVDYAIGDLKFGAAGADPNRRRSAALAAISKPTGSELVSGYAQTSANGRNVVATSTTAEMNAEAHRLAEENIEQAEVPIRAKR